MYRFVVVLLLCTLTPPALSEPYSSEVNLSFSEVDEASFDSEAFSFSARHFWQGVKDRDAPLAELAFLSQSSSIGVSLADRDGKEQIELDNIVFDPVLGISPITQTFTTDIRSDSRAVGFDYVHSDSGWIMGASASSLDTQRTSSFAIEETELEGVDLRLGKYLRPGTRFILSVFEDSGDVQLFNRVPNAEFFDPIDFLNPGFCSVEPGCSRLEVGRVDLEVTGWTASLRHFQSTSWLDFSVTVGVARSETVNKFRAVSGCEPFCLAPGDRNRVENEQSQASVSTKLYFTRSLSLVLFGGKTEADRDGGDADTVAVALEWFVTPKLAFSAGISRLDPESVAGDLGSNSIDTYLLQVRGRF